METSAAEADVEDVLNGNGDVSMQKVTISEADNGFYKFRVLVDNPCEDAVEPSLNDEKRILQGVSEGLRSIDADLYTIDFEGELTGDTLSVAGRFQTE